MKPGARWIHFDAEFPLGFGYDLQTRFGPLGELLFILFLCACKRGSPQGQIQYRNEDEARILLGAFFPFEDEAGDKWRLEDFWKYCGRRKVTRTRARGDRTYVYATRWETWETRSELVNRANQRERKRRSRAKLSQGQSRMSRPEIEIENEIEIEKEGECEGEGRAQVTAGPADIRELINSLEPKSKSKGYGARPK